MTILFCDLVGSTALSERMDPEEFREVLRSYRDVCASVVKRFDGHLAQYTGDGVMVYFGYPLAHEDDAPRAVYAGLEILNELKQLSRRLEADSNIRLAARVGIHTGLVVAGSLGHGQAREEVSAVGDTPNIAARLQSLAEPDTLLISPATRQLVEGLFLVKDLGSKDLKGLSRALTVYQVIGKSDVRSPFEARARRGLIPLLGRDREIELLLDRWERVCNGDGQVVLLSGEAGIGKSRLIREFRDHPDVGRCSRVLCYCSPYHRDAAFFPITDQLERALRFRRSDGIEAKLGKLDVMLAQFGLPVAEYAALIAAFLSLPFGDRYPALNLNPSQMKTRGIEAAVRIIEMMARHEPVLMVVEDAHWIDPSSLEYLAHLVDRSQVVRLLLVISHRAEFSLPWSTRPHFSSLELDRLSPEDCGRIVASIAADELIPPKMQAEIITKADGIPLYVEELTKTVLAGQAQQANGSPRPLNGAQALGVPNTLKDSLMARLDRLGNVKEVAQIGAIIGRQFSHALLRAACPLQPTALAAAISQLTSAELIYRREDASEDLYEFKHVLFQDIAYQSLLKSTRQRVHGRIAGIIEEEFPDTAAVKPELLAHHFTHAGLVQQAIEYWRRASQRAVERAANAEAVAQLDRALELLNTLPATPERDQKELMLLIARGPPLTAMHSYASPELKDNYGRALDLCSRMGKAPQIFPVLLGLYRFYLVRAELQTALKTTTQLLEIATSAQDRGLLMEAHRAQMFSLAFRGELNEATRHFEQCMALFDPDRPHGGMQLYSTETVASALCFGALIAWLQGEPDRAAVTLERALARALKVDHAFTLAWALNYAAVIHQVRGDVAATRRFADHCVAHAQKHEFPFWLAGGRIMRGWSMVAGNERSEDGIAEMRDGIAAWRATGAVLFSPYYLSCLVDGYRRVGRPSDALSPLTEMISAAQNTGERWWEPDLHRLNGELLREVSQSPGRAEQAEACFLHAIELARHQGARSLELRAKMSLCRLWQDHGRGTQARDLLEACLSGFTEGFDTAELRAARQLLAKLV